MRVVDKKGFYSSVLLLVFLSFLFWTQSRVPALDEKAQMGQRNNISSLAFDVVFPLSAEQGHAERILYSAVNWAYTNWQGMTFGLLLAAAFLTLSTFISVQSHYSYSMFGRFKQAAAGVLLGTPLGVCANCSTPISFGLYRSGVPPTLAISMLASSPSFNIIVLTMAFSLLPLELVLLKTLLALLFALVVVPLLCARFSLTSLGADDELKGACEVPARHTWGQFLPRFLSSYFNQLMFILKGALPLMLLAGALAAVVAEFVSLDGLSGDWTIVILLMVAIFAAFFPVPIAFDVVISVALLAAGVDIVYVAAMFFALGIFSIYPAMMIARDLSLRLSVCLFVSVVLLSVLAGALIGLYSEHAQLSLKEMLAAQLVELDELAGNKGSEAEDISSASVDQNAPLPSYLSRKLLRRAARTCHALGEPAQYRCFERFIASDFSNLFSSDSCDYLEDALQYREICNQVFDYRSVVAKSSAISLLEPCDSFSPELRQRCRYDLVFEQTTKQQSLKPCLSLLDRSAKKRCLGDSLRLNLELFPGSDFCSSLDSPDLAEEYFKLCQEGTDAVRRELSWLHQGDLAICQGLNDPEQSRHCQIQLINHKLEQGAGLAICDQATDHSVRVACLDFYHYFQGIRGVDEEHCSKVAQNGLRRRCAEDVVFSRLNQMLLEERYNYLSGLAVESAGDISKGAHVGLLSKSIGVQDAALNLTSESVVRSSLGHSFRIKKYALNSSKDPQGQTVFRQVESEEVGLKPKPTMLATELFEPFSYGRGIAAGDINVDLWPDLALAYPDRVLIYRNRSGHFVEDSVLAYDEGLSPMLVSFADIDGDSQLDLFVSFYGAGNRIYWNQGGYFDPQRFQILQLEGSQVVISASFQDVDQDGDLDFALGGWFAGDLRHFNPHRSQNYYVENAGTASASGHEAGEQGYRRKLIPHALPGVQGESLSVLFTDANRDGRIELMVGNDMDAPDVTYQWANDQFELLNDLEGLPSLSAFNTMSLASGDLNRDKQLDYFSVDMSFGGEPGGAYCAQPGIGDQVQCYSLMDVDESLSTGNVAVCETLKAKERKACVEAQLIKLAKQAREPKYCEDLNLSSPAVRELCQVASARIPPKQPFNYSQYPEGLQRNVLTLSGQERWTEVAEQWGVTESHWSWHSKIADLDNDGWKDIYIGNGYMFGSSGRGTHSNVLFMNQEGQSMRRAESEYGLDDYLNTPGFVTLDFDRDGDLDIISQRVAANLGVFINQTRDSGLLIDLKPNKGSALGAGLYLSDAENSAQGGQLSHIAQGGGFLSFDEPLVHFGMKGKQAYERLEVIWPDTQAEAVSYPFESGHYYLIELDSVPYAEQ